jgi:hypothetical protein
MKRSLRWDALERRVNMSGSVIHPVGALHVPQQVLFKVDHAERRSLDAPAPELVFAAVHGGANVTAVGDARQSAAIKGKLAGGQSSLIPDTNYVAMGGFSGKLGKLSLQATIYGQVSRNRFEGGSMHLFNSQGDIIADLGPGNLAKKGKYEDVKVEFEFEQGTGDYSQVAGSAGTVTIELKPGASSTKTATLGASDRLLDWDVDWAELQVELDSYLKSLGPLFG